MTLKELGEFGFIDRIKEGCLIRKTNVVKAIGDDCAVFKTSGEIVSLFTTDMLVEKVHFLRNAIPAFRLGRKALAVNISDIAAMGGIPKEAVISIAVPNSIAVKYLDQMYDGIKDMAHEFDVNLLGGDTTSEPEHLIINIALIGEANQNEVLYRSGAKAGDIIFLTGSVGSSAAGLDIILNNRPQDQWQDLINAHFDPYPQIKAGRIIAGSRQAHSLIDVSDGVASDLGHICKESGVGAIIEEVKIPATDTFKKYIDNYQLDFELLALHIGEDYVLLGTAPENAAEALTKSLRSKNCHFYIIGKITAEPGIKLLGRDGEIRQIRAGGYDHFRKDNVSAGEI